MARRATPIEYTLCDNLCVCACVISSSMYVCVQMRARGVNLLSFVVSLSISHDIIHV